MMRRRMAYRFLMDLSAGDARGLASHYADVLGEDDEHTVYAATLAAFLDEEE